MLFMSTDFFQNSLFRKLPLGIQYMYHQRVRVCLSLSRQFMVAASTVWNSFDLFRLMISACKLHGSVLLFSLLVCLA